MFSYWQFIILPPRGPFSRTVVEIIFVVLQSKEEVMAVRLREADNIAAMAELQQQISELEIQVKSQHNLCCLYHYTPSSASSFEFLKLPRKPYLRTNETVFRHREYIQIFIDGRKKVWLVCMFLSWHLTNSDGLTT